MTCIRATDGRTAIVKRLLKIGLILLIGIIIGAGTTVFVMGRQVRWLIAFFHETRMVEIANDARLIRAGRAAELLAMKDAAVPQLVVQLEREHARYLTNEERIRCLWAVQRYYKDNPHLTVPAEVEAILEKLPPRPPTSCEIKAAEAAASGQAATTTSSPCTQESN